MTMLEPLVEFGGVLVGKYYARWLGPLHPHDGGMGQIAKTLRKLDVTPGLVIVEVRRFSAIPGMGRYVVRVPGLYGYFTLNDFEWHGTYDGD